MSKLTEVIAAVASVGEITGDQWIRGRALDAALKFHEQNGFKHTSHVLTVAREFEQYIRAGKGV